MTNYPEKVTQGALLIDVRSADEYAQGHFEGSINIPHLEMFEAELPQDKNQTILLHCKMGPRADLAKEILAHRGYHQVENLGGLEDMEALGFQYQE
ncbi:rhodanese-like domain-containing protein [Streptococcus loxodontisalivarius]|uniref:Rhodanese-related sulfurtransferase n=1 Tax=Streptococcus loxodontisalivarius TaxID=1349415 RepID=A0ABS2PT66_9STRE|nr:rhodanese-like domain-containing protein [Streptococcus loxodontisalivarius]MBM7642577.1 rhodanese-related sulfurtransferase [Streptococcus loxodontisalivarius]